MGELRKHYFLDEWVVINEKRGLRPHQFKHTSAGKAKIDFFAPGNESMTPPEIGRIEYKGSWKMRWFDNKFPVFQPGKVKKIKGATETINGAGYHEVIVETPSSIKQLWDLSDNDFHDLMKVYAIRTQELMKKPSVQHVQIFKNHGPDGGTSIIHSHTQIITFPLVPGRLLAKIKANAAKCHYCSLAKKEKKTKRFICDNKNFIAFAPYASRFNYEAWILPKKHIKSIVDMTDDQLKDLGSILRKLLVKLKQLNCSFNYFLINAPERKDLHFHLELTPRIAKWAGFEIGTDVIVNSVSPENAAKFYKGILKTQKK